MSMNEYEDYMYGMRNFNGMMMGGMSDNQMMNYNYNNCNNCNNSGMMNNSMESMYPEIYRVIQPMVIKACDSLRYTNMGNTFITVNILDDLTDNIYRSVENEERSSEENADNQRSSENDDNTRQRRNLLRDLIRILLIRELLRRGYNTYSPYGYGYRPY